MSIEAEAFDGSVHEFPDGTPQETINLRLKAYTLKAKAAAGRRQAEFQKQVAARKEAAESPLTHGAKVLGQSIGKTFLELNPVTFPLINMTPNPSDYASEEELAKQGMTRQPGIDEKLQELGTRPGSKVEEWLSAGGSGAAAAIAGAPGAALERPLFTLASGAGGGVGSEAGGAIGGEGPSEGLRRFLGGLVGSALPGSYRAFMGHKEDLAKKALQDVSPEELQRARRAMYDAQQEGVPLTLSQAMDRDSTIDRIADVLQTDVSGVKSQRLLREQPPQVSGKMKVNIARLPGEATSRQEAANIAQEASTEALKQADEFRRAEFLKLFGNEGQVRLPTKVMETLDARLNQLERQYVNQPAAESIQDLRQALRDGRLPARDFMKMFDWEVGDAPVSQRGTGWVNQVEELSAILRSHKAGLSAPGPKAKPLAKEEAVKVKGALDLVRDELERFSPGLKAANERYRELSRTLVNPLKKGPVGRLAARGANETEEAAANRAFAIFDEGTTGRSEILTLQREWSKAGQDQAFLDVAKSWLTRKLTQNIKDFGDRPNVANPQALYTALSGNEAQKQGLRDLLVGMAKAQGLDDSNAYADGFMNFMKVVGAAARRPHLPPGESVPALQQGAGGNLISWFLKLFSIVPFSEAAYATKRYYSQKAFSAMDEIMTDPDKVPMLLELAKEPIMSRKAQVLVNSLLASTAADLNDVQELPPELRAEMRAR